MSVDFIFLAIIGMLTIGGGLYLLIQAKAYRARRQNDNNPVKHS